MQNNTLLQKLLTLCLHKTAVFSFVLCLSAIFCILGTASQAQALSVCHGDPIVQLSNGITLQATVDVAIAPTQLGNLQITYTFHVPSGVSIQKVTYTGGSLAGRESVQLDADQTSNSYSEQVLATASYSASLTTTTTYHGQSMTFKGVTNQPILMAES